MRTKQKRLAGLCKAMKALANHQEEFSCNAVGAFSGYPECLYYATAMGQSYDNGEIRGLQIDDIVQIFPQYGQASKKQDEAFAEVMDFRVWLVAIYYGYVASGAQDEIDARQG